MSMIWNGFLARLLTFFALLVGALLALVAPRTVLRSIRKVMFAKYHNLEGL